MDFGKAAVSEPSQMKRQKNPSEKDDLIAANKKARHKYELVEKYEAGLALLGSEVKSLRNKKASIEEAFGRVRGGEIYLIGMHIAPYEQANILNHDPLRPRKLLLRKREINRIVTRIQERGFTLVPTRLYFKHGLAKVEVATARGKRLYDRRQDIKKRDQEREIRRAMSRKR